MFCKLDINKDGFIDFGDWSKVIVEEGNSLQYIKDVIRNHHLESDDVLKHMGFCREQGALNYY